MNQIQKFFDRITFKQTFIFWILFMLVFGLIYFVLSFSENNDLLYRDFGIFGCGAPRGTGK